MRGRLRLLDALFLRYLLVKVSPKGGTRILDLSGVTDELWVIRRSVLRGRLRLLDASCLRCLLVKVSPKGGTRMLDLRRVANEPAVIRQLCVARQAAFTRHVVLEVFVKKRLARRAARGY